MSDGWEIAHGLDPLSNDTSLDPDGDGFSNIYGVFVRNKSTGC